MLARFNMKIFWNDVKFNKFLVSMHGEYQHHPRKHHVDFQSYYFKKKPTYLTNSENKKFIFTFSALHARKSVNNLINLLEMVLNNVLPKGGRLHPVNNCCRQPLCTVNNHRSIIVDNHRQFISSTSVQRKTLHQPRHFCTRRTVVLGRG